MASAKFSFTILALACFHLIPSAAATVTNLQDVLYNGTVTAETVSSTGSLDGHKLTPAANDTSYEWWYFDAVSTTSHYESVDIVFYDVGPDGFIGGYNNGPLSASVSGSFENGTTFDIEVSAKGGAVITDDAAGISGNWSGSGFSFHGSSLNAPDVEYVIEISNDDLGVSGTVRLRSSAPPRLPCTPNSAGLSEQAFPTVFWTSAQPDAAATVDLTIGGTPLRFTGVGYHDKNWGVSPFAAVVAQSYWGHAHVGPYSVVWGDDLANVPGNASPQEYTSLYLARDGSLVKVSCGAATVRPWGANATYPPTYATGPPTGFEVTFDLGEEGGVFRLNVTTDLMVVDAGVYQRFIGTARGGFDCSREQYEGRALYEQFKFIGFPGS